MKVDRVQEQTLLEIEHFANLRLIFPRLMDRNKHNSTGFELIPELGNGRQLADRSNICDVPEVQNNNPAAMLGKGADASVGPAAKQPFRCELANRDRSGPGALRYVGTVWCRGLLLELNPDLISGTVRHDRCASALSLPYATEI